MSDQKWVVVTGAAGGMGQALCAKLVSHGYRVLGIDHEADRLGTLAEKLPESFKPKLFDLQLGSWKDLEREIHELDGVSALINLAGISVGNAIESCELEDWQQSFEVNATAPFKLSKLIIPKLKAGGGGAILNVSSPVGLIGARKPSYAASKAALTGLTMSMAKNLGKDNIRVNLVLPGTTITYMTCDWSESKREAIAAESHLGRLCEPDELAECLLFMISEKNSYMSGAIIDMTCGGMYGH